MKCNEELFRQWPERIKTRLKELSMTQEDLAKELQVTLAAVAHYLGGRRTPPLKQFQKLAKVLQVNPIWLQYGFDPFKETELAKAARKFELPVEIARIPILTWKKIAEIQKLEDIDYMQQEEYVPHIYTDELGQYAVRIKGDAMTAPSGHMVSYREGELILVNPWSQKNYGDSVVVVLPDATEATLRQFVMDSGVEYLKPLNPQYPLVKINDDVRFLGVVAHRIG